MVALPGVFYEELNEAAESEAISVSTLHAGIVAGALGYLRGFVDGGYRLARSDPNLRIERALDLLSRALVLPIHVDGTYQAAELARILGVRPSSLTRWHQEGWLPSIGSQESNRRYYRGATILAVLMEQAYIPVRAAELSQGAAPLRRRGSAPAPDPA